MEFPADAEGTVHGFEEKLFVAVVANNTKHVVFVFVVMATFFEKVGFGDLWSPYLSVGQFALDAFDIFVNRTTNK